MHALKIYLLNSNNVMKVRFVAVPYTNYYVGKVSKFFFIEKLNKRILHNRIFPQGALNQAIIYSTGRTLFLFIFSLLWYTPTNYMVFVDLCDVRLSFQGCTQYYATKNIYNIQWESIQYIHNRYLPIQFLVGATTNKNQLSCGKAEHKHIIINFLATWPENLRVRCSFTEYADFTRISLVQLLGNCIDI